LALECPQVWGPQRAQTRPHSGREFRKWFWGKNGHYFRIGHRCHGLRAGHWAGLPPHVAKVVRPNRRALRGLAAPV